MTEERKPPQIGDTIYYSRDGGPWEVQGNVVGFDGNICLYHRTAEAEARDRAFCKEHKITYETPTGFIFRFTKFVDGKEVTEWNSMHRWEPPTEAREDEFMGKVFKLEPVAAPGELKFACYLTQGTPVLGVPDLHWITDKEAVVVGDLVRVDMLFGVTRAKVTSVDLEKGEAIAESGSNAHFLRFENGRWMCVCSGNMAGIERAKFI